ncbi:MAG: 7TMR-DISMED2 domain-containing protein, partial [Nevskiales bacterium]
MSRHYKASANSCNVARLLRAFFCAFLLFGLLPAEAATTTAVAEISADTEILDLNPYLEYLPDEQGRLTIDDVSRPPLAGDFKRNTQKVFNAGLTAKPYWYRLILKYGSATVGRSNQEWFLEIGDAYLDYVDFYAAGPDGEWRVIHTGEQLP